MGGDDGGADRDSIIEEPVERAVEVVVNRHEDVRPQAARSALEAVSEDGVVTQDGVDEAIAHLSKVVSTPETRLELAALDLADAREAAEPVAHRPLVRDRLDSFEDRLEAVRQAVETLGADLQTLLDRRGEAADVYSTAAEIRRLTETANRLQRAADELQVSLDEFETWVTDPAHRVETFEGDVDALAESLETVADAVDALGATGREATGGDASARDWFDATVRCRVLGVVIEDLSWELDELQRWAEREAEADPAALAAFPGRLDELRDRRATLEEALEALARPEWRDRFGERLTAVAEAIDDVEPPVDWNALDAAIDAQRSDASRTTAG